MASPGLSFLDAGKVTRIIQLLQDIRTLPPQLIFLNRLPKVNAFDDEIMASYIGEVLMADLIADDAMGLTYSSGKMVFESYAVPNAKIGMNLPQSLIRQLTNIGGYGGVTNTMMDNLLRQKVDGLLLGVLQRWNALSAAMMIDSFSYNRLGIQASGVSWGMPSNLKVTLTSTATWDSASTADPVADFLALIDQAATVYGHQFNRATMSRTAFRYMTATTSFQNRAKSVISPTATPGYLVGQRVENLIPIVETLTGLQIELYDGRAYTQAQDGTRTATRFLPVATVLLSNTMDDNNPATWDFAQGITTESQLAGLEGGMGTIGTIPQGQFGPVAYVEEPKLNPPQLTMWAVGRGFPRKHVKHATAVLTTGTYSDLIAVTEPY
jgi:hypothetical protein